MKRCRNGVIIVIIIMLCGVAILPSINSENSIFGIVNFNEILYVGGSGSGNYSTIQDAINDSIDIKKPCLYWLQEMG